MVWNVDEVLEGRVVSRTVEALPQPYQLGRTTNYTLVDVKVEAGLTGSSRPGDTVSFYEMGDPADPIWTGTLSCVGERLFLFLQQAIDSHPAPDASAHSSHILEYRFSVSTDGVIGPDGPEGVDGAAFGFLIGRPFSEVAEHVRAIAASPRPSRPTGSTASLPLGTTMPAYTGPPITNPLVPPTTVSRSARGSEPSATVTAFTSTTG